jgi:hypothetical protein
MLDEYVTGIQDWIYMLKKEWPVPAIGLGDRLGRQMC